ncbi:MAG: phosphoadenylyl-sulfate reductase [Bacteroidales bacterium]
MKENIDMVNDRFRDASPQEILDHFLRKYRGEIAFSSSMGAEDQVLTHMINQLDPTVRIFTLDTGRLFQETYDLIDKTNSRFGIHIEVFFPERKKIEQMTIEKGMNLFYHSIENRKLCCHIRKIEPLKRALRGMSIWITGLRNDQSVTRKENGLIEWDEVNNILKLNPLISWSTEMVWDHIHTHDLPYNALHDKGYPSIGCLPCTRAVKPGEDIRSGRWWWENPEMKECGLHKK